MRERTVVLGGGISAMSYLLYHPEAFALGGPERGLGGLAALQDRVGPHLVWADLNTERLLRDLKLPTESREVRVGYLVSSEVVGSDQMSAAEFSRFRDAYSYKTRGTGARPSHMSSGRGTFAAVKVEMREVVAKLYEAVSFRVVPVSAKGLLLWDQVVISDGEEEHSYDHLVSTIPAPVFLRLTGMQHLSASLEARDKAYRSVSYAALPPWATRAQREGFEYAYVADPAIEFHRIKYLPDRAVLEYTFPSGIPTCVRDDRDAFKHPAGQVIGGAEVFRSLPPSVELLGRFAQWDHSVKLNQVLERVLRDTPPGCPRTGGRITSEGPVGS